MTEQPPINPRVWRKFSQAQDNFRKANNCSSVNGRWKWNGRKYPMKQRRRQLKWADAMAHCSPEVKSFWTEELAKRGVKV